MKIIPFRTIFWVMSLLLITPVGYACIRGLDCPEDIVRLQSDWTMAGDYSVRYDLARKAGLEWMRCSLGQNWDESSSTCTGEANKFTFSDAIAYLKDFEYQGYGWRVPTKDELSKLVVCGGGGQVESYQNGQSVCNNKDDNQPTIEKKAFPETPSGEFWSSSEKTDNAKFVWIVNFKRGEVRWNYKKGNSDTKRFVRLVRNY